MKKQYIHYDKGIATIAICASGAWAMYITNGSTGIGWSILGIMVLWGS